MNTNATLDLLDTAGAREDPAPSTTAIIAEALDLLTEDLHTPFALWVLGDLAAVDDPKAAVARFTEQYVGRWDCEAAFAAAYLRAAGMPESLLDLIDLDAPMAALLDAQDAPYRVIHLLDQMYVFATATPTPSVARVLRAQ